MEFTEETILKIIVWFFCTLGFIVLCFAITAVVAFRTRGKEFAKEYCEALIELNILQIMMAVVMVFAATMLAVAKIISAEAVVTIISGITGYVLGGVAQIRPSTLGRKKNTDEQGGVANSDSAPVVPPSAPSE